MNKDTNIKLKQQLATLLTMLVLSFMNTSLSMNKSQLCPNPAILIFVNFAVSILTLILQQSVPLLPPLFTPSLTTTTHFIIIYQISK